MKLRPCLAVAVSAVSLLGVSCGSSSTQPSATPPTREQAANVVTTLPPSPAPTPTPAATPAPSPSPTAPPCTQGLCEAPTTNINAPMRLTLRLYKVVLPNGKLMQGLTDSSVIPVGSEATVDATAKDEFNNDTLGSGHVDFWVENNGTVRAFGTHDYQRKLQVLNSGTVDIQGHMDGVASNVLTLHLGN